MIRQRLAMMTSVPQDALAPVQQPSLMTSPHAGLCGLQARDRAFRGCYRSTRVTIEAAPVLTSSGQGKQSSAGGQLAAGAAHGPAAHLHIARIGLGAQGDQNGEERFRFADRLGWPLVWRAGQGTGKAWTAMVRRMAGSNVVGSTCGGDGGGGGLGHLTTIPLSHASASHRSVAGGIRYCQGNAAVIGLPPPRLQDFLCGIRGKDFVMVCSDTSAVQSIVTMKQVGRTARPAACSCRLQSLFEAADAAVGMVNAACLHLCSLLTKPRAWPPPTLRTPHCSTHCCLPLGLLQDEDKLVPVDSHKLFAISGEAGDRVNFSEYIIANVSSGCGSVACSVKGGGGGGRQGPSPTSAAGRLVVALLLQLGPCHTARGQPHPPSAAAALPPPAGAAVCAAQRAAAVNQGSGQLHAQRAGNSPQKGAGSACCVKLAFAAFQLMGWSDADQRAPCRL